MVSSSSKSSVTCSPRWTVRGLLCASTRVRKSWRVLAYASSVSRLSRVMRGMRLPSVLVMVVSSKKSFRQTVGDPEQSQRVRLARAGFALRLDNALLDRPAGYRAVRADVVRLAQCHLAEYR